MKKIFLLFALVFFLVSITNVKADPRRVLLEYCTGTWCGWCPCGHQTIENQIIPAYPQTIFIAYHGASSDPWQNFDGYEIRSMLGFNAYPTGIVDRTNTPSNPYYEYTMWMNGVTTRYNTQPTATVNLVMTQKNYNSTTRDLTVTVNATAAQTLSGLYKISFVLIENNLVYPQNHYSSCGYVGYINDYVHKHVARSMMNGPTGDTISNGTWNVNQMYSKTVVKNIFPTWNAANCEVIVFVYKDNPVLALGGVNQSYIEAVTTPLGIETNNEVPKGYELSQNYPNPFNPVTQIKFSVPEKTNASLKIFDITGKEVYSYFDGIIEAGSYTAEFDGLNLSSGIYFYTLSTPKFTETKKMTLVK